MKPESCKASHVVFDKRDLPGILKDIEEVLRSGRLILGPQTEALEREFASFVGTEHAVALSSCTAALEIALDGLVDVDRPEVIVPTNTFAATAAAVVRTGRKVVFCESHPNDFCLDVGDVIRKTTDRTGGIIAVHLAGFIPHGMDDLVDFCKVKGIALVEDCAHAHGATMGGQMAGSIGDAGCFSFYPTKIMTSCVGGMLTTNNVSVDALARSVRHHGSEGDDLTKIIRVGADYLMDEVRAVLARWQLRRLPEVLAHRRAVAACYDSWLPKEVKPATPAPNTKPSYYKYPVVLSSDIGVIDRLDTYGIRAGVLYRPQAHDMDPYKYDKFSKTEELLSRQICLPMHAGVDPNDCPEIARALWNSLGLDNVSHNSST